MRERNPLKTTVVVDFAASVCRGGDVPDSEGRPREDVALEIAAAQSDPALENRVLTPELRASLDAMNQDYARILTRIDQLSIASRVARMPTPNRRNLIR